MMIFGSNFVPAYRFFYLFFSVFTLLYPQQGQYELLRIHNTNR